MLELVGEGAPTFGLSDGGRMRGGRAAGAWNRPQADVRVLNGAAATQCHGAFQHVLELAHVARVVVGLERAPRLGAELEARESDAFLEAREDRLGQRADVVAPL